MKIIPAITKEKMEAIKTTPAEASLMIFISGWILGSILSQMRSRMVFIASKEITKAEQNKTEIHSKVEIWKNQEKKIKINNKIIWN